MVVRKEILPVHLLMLIFQLKAPRERWNKLSLATVKKVPPDVEQNRTIQSIINQSGKDHHRSESIKASRLNETWSLN